MYWTGASGLSLLASWLSVTIGGCDFVTDALFAKLVFTYAHAFCWGGASRQLWVVDSCCSDQSVDPILEENCQAATQDLQLGPDVCTAAYSTLSQICSRPTNCTAGDSFSSQCCPELCDDSCQPRSSLVLFAVIVIVAVALPCVLAILPLWRVARQRAMLDSEMLRQHGIFYSIVYLLSTTNLELLKLLPWQYVAKTYDGFPRAWMLQTSLWFAVLEDVPQAVLLGIFALVIQPTASTNPIVVASACFSVFSFTWRVLRKVILLLSYTADAGETTRHRFAQGSDGLGGWTQSDGRSAPERVRHNDCCKSSSPQTAAAGLANRSRKKEPATSQLSRPLQEALERMSSSRQSSQESNSSQKLGQKLRRCSDADVYQQQELCLHVCQQGAKVTA
eukprot:6205749-Pleurochrysis_carterae.AAC.4